MTDTDVLAWCELNIEPKATIVFPEEVFSSLTTESAKEITRLYGHTNLMVLPQREQDFFEWLKEHDVDVWSDLWSHDDEQPYVVSLAFLPAFLDPSRGFPICDLESVENYFFVPALVQGENAKDFIEAVRERFLAKQKLTVEQLLALECSLAPIDIWHFAWHHSVDLARAKTAVAQLVDDQILIHLKSSGDIAEYIE